MHTSFTGMPSEALDFFQQLEKNNNRPWFQAHKQLYLEKVRAPMELLVEAISSALLEFAPDYATPANAAIYRIYRDTRFSSDKTPYKTNSSALFHHSGLQSKSAAAFYLEISTQYFGLAGGIYMPTTEYLRAIRLHLMRHHDRFSQLVKDRGLIKAMGTLQGNQLTRPPRGFSAEDPAAEWVRYKQWYFWQELDPKLATSAGVLKEVVTRFRRLAAVVQFLNEPLLELQQQAPLRFDLTKERRK